MKSVFAFAYLNTIINGTVQGGKALKIEVPLGTLCQPFTVLIKMFITGIYLPKQSKKEQSNTRIIISNCVHFFISFKSYFNCYPNSLKNMIRDVIDREI